MPLFQKAYLGSTPLFAYGFSPFVLVNQSSAVTLTSSLSPHAKGSWTEVISATSGNSSLLVIQVTDIGTSGVSSATLIDIGTGASGAESSIIANIPVGGASILTSTSLFGGIVFYVPFKIASGTRIAARIQSVVAGGRTARVTITAINFGDYDAAPTSVDTIGSNTEISRGIAMSGSSGTWVQAIASTSRKYRGVVFVPSISSDNTDSVIVQFDIGVGASGSEIPFGYARMATSSTEASNSAPPYLTLFGRDIPAGSRLAVRHNRTTNSNLINFCLIGIP